MNSQHLLGFFVALILVICNSHVSATTECSSKGFMTSRLPCVRCEQLQQLLEVEETSPVIQDCKSCCQSNPKLLASRTYFDTAIFQHVIEKRKHVDSSSKSEISGNIKQKYPRAAIKIKESNLMRDPAYHNVKKVWERQNCIFEKIYDDKSPGVVVLYDEKDNEIETYSLHSWSEDDILEFADLFIESAKTE